MSEMQPWPASGEMNRQHVIIGGTAAALSILAHVAILVYLVSLEFAIPIVPERFLSRPSVRSVRLLDVRRGTEAEDPSRSTLRRWDPGVSADPTRMEDLPRVLPDESVIRPPELSDGQLAGDTEALAEPEAPPPSGTWDRKQEVLAIEKKLAADDVSELSRRRIPRIERVRDLDVSSLAPKTEDGAGTALASAGGLPGQGPGRVVISHTISGGSGDTMSELVVGEEKAESGTGLFPETPSDITPLKPVDDLLVAEVTVFESLRHWKYGYFTVEIKRKGPEALPVIPKDVVFVQDCSASMTEQRLYFCREGLLRALDQVGPDDRFNVISFRDGATWCFHDWSESNAANREKARMFIEGMKSSGETDIFTSAKSLLELRRGETRPVVVLLVTDGIPTKGLLDSTDIIGEFSKLNDGVMAVFTMGTVQTANEYLLDLLAYCNGGGSFVVDRGRWDIPDSMQRIAGETGRPVLHDIVFRFADGCECEVFPALTSNLYLDRTLVLYGRYPKGLERLAFQVVGKGRDARCDSIFTVDLRAAERTKNDRMRDDWARQKIYHLIGEHARTGNAALLEDIRSTSRAYGISVPYRGEF